MAFKKNAPVEFDESEDSGLIAKVTQNRLQDLGVSDGVQVANFVTNFLPGGQVVGVPLAGIEGAFTTDREKAEYEKIFGDSLDRMSHGGRGVRRSLNNLKNRWKNNMGEAAASGVGAFGGMSLAGLLTLGGPVGWAAGAVGMLAGGYIGSTAYNKTFNKQNQDPLILAKQIAKMQSRGQYVPPELVFATLAANLQQRMGDTVDNMLEQATGTRLFHQAIANPDTIGKVTLLMRNKRIDSYIRANNLLPLDPNNPNKSAAEQMAELINSRRIRAKDLLYPNIDVIKALADNSRMIIQHPRTSFSPSGTRSQRIAAVSADVTQLPLPLGNQGPRRNI